MNAEHPCSCDGTVVSQEKYEAHSTPDQTELQDAFLVQRSVQPRGHGIRTILRVPGNANGISAQAFDLVMTALRLHVDPGTGCQAVAIDQFSRGHIRCGLLSGMEALAMRMPFRGQPTASHN